MRRIEKSKILKSDAIAILYAKGRDSWNTFMEESDIKKIIFKGDLAGYNFTGYRFKGETIFKDITFNEKANFNQAVFLGTVDFSRSTFLKEATFRNAHFNQIVNFNGAVFKQRTYFSRAIFDQKAHFYRTQFEGRTHFTEVEFNNVSFRFSYFHRFVSFADIDKFKGITLFIGVRFKSIVDFNNSIFGTVYFNRATFEVGARFSNCIFNDWAFFNASTAIGGMSFHNTVFSCAPSFINYTGPKNFISNIDVHYSNENAYDWWWKKERHTQYVALHTSSERYRVLKQFAQEVNYRSLDLT